MCKVIDARAKFLDRWKPSDVPKFVVSQLTGKLRRATLEERVSWAQWKLAMWRHHAEARRQAELPRRT